MIAILEFANNVVATLAQNIPSSGAGSTTAIVSTGQGAQFPALSGGQNFIATFVAASNPTIREIVLCTARTSDTLTIVRAQEGTTALAWSIGDTVNMRPTAGTMRAFLQADQISAAIISAADYAVDTGSANAYSGTYVPAVTALVDGLKLRLKIAHTNTGASTFSPNGLTAVSISTIINSALIGGVLLAGAEVELTYNSSGTWVITSASQATEGNLGVLPVATQALVNAGTDDESTVTPKKLGNGFTFTAAFPGLIKLPSWLGGFMMQWGQSAALSTGSQTATGTISFGVSFSSCFWCGGFPDDVAQTGGWNPITCIFNAPSASSCAFVADTGGGSAQPITNSNVHIRFLAIGKS